MLTIFSCPKPFKAHNAVIQRNAIFSWTVLRPKPEISLMGDEDGTVEVCRKLGLRHVPLVQRNEFGTPLLSDLFEKARGLNCSDTLCYVNADIVLLSNFSEAIERVSCWHQPFLMVGRRWDLDITEPLGFVDSGWEAQLIRTVDERGIQRPAELIDYFIFSRDVYRDLPPLALGRVWWDNWLIWKARSLGVPVVDASLVTKVIHQNHDYGHHPGGHQGVWQGEEARRNYELAGGWAHCCTIDDATHRLTHEGIRRNLTRRYLLRRLEMARRWSIDKTRPLRHRIGLRTKG